MPWIVAILNALDCCDPVSEEMLVSFCLHRMTEEYNIFLENLSFSSFAKLMEATSHTKELVHRSSRFSMSVRPSQTPMGRQMQRKRPILTSHDNAGESRSSGSKIRYQKRERYRPRHPSFAAEESYRALKIVGQRLCHSPVVRRTFPLLRRSESSQLLLVPS